MGQPIEVSDEVVGDIASFSTDRSITGQDGADFVPPAKAEEGLPGRLAALLFAADGELQHVFVASNAVVARRRGGWDESALALARDVVRDFFVFYKGDGGRDQPSEAP